MTREETERRRRRIGSIPAPVSRPGARKMTLRELLIAARRCRQPMESMWSSLCGHQPDPELTKTASRLVAKHWDWESDKPYEALDGAFEEAIHEVENS